MTQGLNKVQLIGNLGADVKLNHTHSGTPVSNFRLATGNVHTDRDGVRQEDTEWHRLVAFGPLAEIANEYLKKGSKVYVEGRLQTKPYMGSDGVERQNTEIVISSIVFLGNLRAPDDEVPNESKGE